MTNESREFEVELELKARVATRDIDDIMCAALEGGITGWCRAAKPVGKMLGEYGHEQIARVAPSCSMMLRAAISGS